MAGGTATKAFPGAGANISIGNTVVQQVKSFTYTPMKWTLEDITSLSSPQMGVGVIKEVMPTLVTPGELAAQGTYLPSDAGRLALDGACISGLVQTFTIQYPVDKAGGQANIGDSLVFSGYVTDRPLPDGADPTKPVMYKLAITLTSNVAYTQGT